MKKIQLFFIFIFISLFLLWYSNISFIKLGFIGAILIGIIIFMDVKFSLFILITLFFALNYLLALFGLPGKLTFIMDFMVYVMFIYALLNGKKKMYVIDIFLIVYILFLITSSLTGENIFLVKLKGVLNYIKYPIFALTLMRIKLNKEDYKKIIYYIIFLSFLQVPTSIIQRLVGFVPDNSGGFLAFNASTINAILMTIMFIIMLSSIIVYGVQKKYIFASVILTIPFVFSSARAGFLFYGVALILALSFYLLHIKNTGVFTIFYSILGTMVIFVSVYLILLYVMPIFEPENANTIELISSPENIKAYLTGTDQAGRLKRFETFLFGYKYIKKDFSNFLLGIGPGSMLVSQNFGAGQFAEQYGDIFSFSLSLPSFIVEIGVGGVIIYLSIYIYIIFYSLSIVSKIKDGFFKIIAFSLPMISIIMIIASVYTNVWSQEGLQAVFWILTASIISLDESEFKKSLYSIILVNSVSNFNKKLEEIFEKTNKLKKEGISEIIVIFSYNVLSVKEIQIVDYYFRKNDIVYIIPDREEDYKIMNVLSKLFSGIYKSAVLILDIDYLFEEEINQINREENQIFYCEQKNNVKIVKTSKEQLTVMKTIINKNKENNTEFFIKELSNSKYWELLNLKRRKDV